ncbi:hypothetical protein KM043_018649 [Ampulex compressa]|nr:hypothetical protein KM043_018649 [Ampulex compressa]
MILAYVLLALLNEVLCSGNGKEHVHFKVHVPEIIKHHIHTKTVFVHVHKTVPKKKPKKKEGSKSYHQEEHHDWGSWNSYEHHDDKHDDEHHSKEHKDEGKDYGYKHHKEYDDKHKDHKYQDGNGDKEKKEYKDHGYPKKHEDHGYKNIYTYYPLYEHQKDSYMPQAEYSKEKYEEYPKQEVYSNGMIGYSYPPQYAVHEKVKEMYNNAIEPYAYSYEKGYKKGSHAETEQVYSNELSKFHDNNHEESGESEEKYQEESEEKTNSGRYLVDDTEYENNSNKYEDSEESSRRSFIG